MKQRDWEQKQLNVGKHFIHHWKFVFMRKPTPECPVSSGSPDCSGHQSIWFTKSIISYSKNINQVTGSQSEEIILLYANCDL